MQDTAAAPNVGSALRLEAAPGMERRRPPGLFTQPADTLFATALLDFPDLRDSATRQAVAVPRPGVALYSDSPPPARRWAPGCRRAGTR